MKNTAPPRRDEPDREADQQKLRMRMILLSFFVSIALMGIKFLVFFMTHSSAVLSDALESIINVVASAFATLSVWMASKPPDPEHPYGHGKIEYFSAGFEGALIVLAALGIFYTGIQHLIHPHELPHLGQGSALLVGATIVNLLLGIGLMRTGRRTDSVTLIADGKHIIADVYTSAAVVAGLLVVYWTGWIWMDGAIACLVGLNILITGAQLVRQAAARLMDASDPRLLNRIAAHIEAHRRPVWLDVHQLRSWRAGTLIHIDLHLVLPDNLTLQQAHDEARTLEISLVDHFGGNASVLVHLDPCGEHNCTACEQDGCAGRSHQTGPRRPWPQDHLTRYRRRPGHSNGQSTPPLRRLDTE